MMSIMVRSKRRKIRWLKKGESDRLRILTQNFSQEDNLVNTLRFTTYAIIVYLLNRSIFQLSILQLLNV